MSDAIFRDVDFDEGFKRGDEKVLKVKLRRPSAGELRGLSTVDLIRQEYAAIEAVAPRITTPIMTKADVAGLCPADLLTLGSEVAAFFLNKTQAAEAGLEA